MICPALNDKCSGGQKETVDHIIYCIVKIMRRLERNSALHSTSYS